MKFKHRHRSTGWLFPYQERFCYLMLHGLFRNIHLKNKHLVPVGKPVLLAVNHPTAFMEPIILCCLLDPPIYNMTRGDIFKKPIFSKIMHSVNMFPVFRTRDGYTEANRNDEVFEYCVQKMAEKNCVAIYVEGMHHIDRQLRPIQKGIARIAFGAYEQLQDDDLMIIPIGCNFENGDAFRDAFTGIVGEPIYIKDRIGEYREHAGQATRSLCDEIESRLKKLCYHVEEKADLALTEHLLAIDKNDNPDTILPIIRYDNLRFLREKELVDGINASVPEQKKVLLEQTTQYFEQIQHLGIKDMALVQAKWGNQSNMFLLLLSFPLFFIGKTFHYIPGRIAWFLADKKVKKREFYSSVLGGSGLLLNQLWYFVWLIIALITQNIFIFCSILLMPILGWFSLVWKEYWFKFWAVRKANASEERKALLHTRNALQAQIQLIKKEA